MPIDDLPPIGELRPQSSGIEDLPPIGALQPTPSRGAFEGIFDGGDEGIGSGGAGFGGVLERSGIRAINSLGSIGGGFLRLGEGAAREFGLDDAADAIDRFADARDTVGSRPIRGVAEGGTELEQAEGLGATASALGRFVGSDPAGFAGYAAENVLGSVPDMLGAALVPYAYFGSRAGSSGAARAANDGRDQTNFLDVLKASPGTAAEVALERFATKNLGGGGVVAGAAREGGTEFGQNLAQYAGETAGTQTGFDLDTGLGQGLQGAAIGAPFGGVSGAVSALSKRGGSRTSSEPVAGDADFDFDGSLDDVIGGDQGIDDLPPIGDLPALPAPTVYVDSAGDAAVGADGQAELERTEAARRVERGRPEPVTGDAAIEAYMQRNRSAESGGDDAARNPNSSATGRYQFIDDTWLNLYKQRYGDQGMSDADILAKRGDGEVQDALMRDFTNGNARTLDRAGIPVTEGNLYLAHFAGPGGALKLHRSDPGASVESVLGQGVVDANPFLAGQTASQVIDWAAGKMGQRGAALPVVDGDTPAIDLPEVPGADGSLLGRGDAIDGTEITDLSPGQRDAPTPIEIPAERLGDESEVTTARGQRVNTQFAVVDAAEITTSANPAYLQALQPRDRATRSSSEAQIAQIAGNLDPAQLGDSRLASTGAPIIGPDGMVESGNGRTAAIERAYQTNPQGAQAYRDMVEAKGFDTSGMERPVLVRRRTTDMTPQQRLAWTRAANERDTMAMSSTEQAAADAGNIGDATLALYRGGPITAAANRDFVRAFMQTVSPSERNALMSSDGSVSADGLRRVQSALLSKAYGDANIVAKVSEDTDANIVAIGKALTQAAPAFARLKARIAAGDVPAQYDISGDVSKAAQMVSRSRETGQSIAGMLSQTDAFAQVSPEVEQILRIFYRGEDMKRPRSGAKVADALMDYVDRAERVGDAKRQGNDMFGNAPELPAPAVLLEQARVALDGEAQPDLLGTGQSDGDAQTSAPDPATVPNDDQGNRPAGPARGSEAGRDRSGRPDNAVLARGQLRGLGIAREIRTQSTASLIGRNVGSAKEMAQVAQVFRDPRYETLRIFYTKGDEIVHTTGVSTRSVASVAFQVDGSRNDRELFANMEAAMKASGADGYYLLHNHPSGDPSPSGADRNMTAYTASNVDGFRGHIVINSNKYAEIDANGQSGTFDIDGAPDTTPAVQNTALGRVVNSPASLVALAKELQKPGFVTVIGTSTKGQTRVILDYREDAPRSTKELAAIARRIQRNSGSSRLFLVGDRTVLDSPVVKRALRDGIVTDAIDRDGKSITRSRSGKRQPLPEGAPRRVAEANRPFDPPEYGMDRQRRKEQAEADRLGITPLQAKRRMEARDFIRRNDPRAARIMDLREDDAGFDDTIEIDGKQRSTVNSDGKPLAKDEAGVRAFWKWFGDSKVVDADGRPLVVYHGTPAQVSDDFAFNLDNLGANGRTEGVGNYFTTNRTIAEGYGKNGEVVETYLSIKNPMTLEMPTLSVAKTRAFIKAVVDAEAKADGAGVGDGYLSNWGDVESEGFARVLNAAAQGNASSETLVDQISDLVSSGVQAKIVNRVVVDHLGYDGVFAEWKGNLETASDVPVIVALNPEQIKSVNNRGTFDPDDARILREDPAPFIRENLVNGDGLKRDTKMIRDIVGNPREAMKNVGRSGFADVGRWAFYTMDSRMRQMAERFNSEAINDLADMFHARSGKMDKAVGETYHEAVDREGFGRASKAWQILAPFQGDKTAMERIGLMLRDPSRRTKGKKVEAKAAAEIAALLKDTIDYRKKAGEDIGEVTDGYFPRWMNVEKVITKQDLFRQRAEQLYQRHGLDADDAKAAANAWMARILDQYAGLDGGLEYASLFRDTRPAGVGRTTTKAREFGKDADKLLGDFYQNDTGEVITAYMIGSARKAEEVRRFGIEGDGRPKLRAMMERIKKQVRNSDEDAGEALDVLAKMVNTNLGRIDVAPGAWRNTASLLQTASQLGTLDRATYTSLSEAMMGFVRAGPKYGLPMLKDSVRNFARQLRNAPPDEAQRMAEALGIAADVMVSEALAARAGYEMGSMTRRAQKVQQGFFRATGLHQWTEGTRVAATRMGQKFLSDLAADMDGPKAARSAGYLKELGVKNPKAFAAWLRENGGPSPDAVGRADADAMTQQYRTALMRFTNQTIMKPSRAEKPSWASHPVGSLFFSLMSFSYGYKKNVLDRVYRTGKQAIKTKDPALLYPAFGLAGLFAVHTVLNSIIRPVIFGGGRQEDDDETTLESGIKDLAEAADRAGLTGAASRPLNALWGLRYRQGIIESMMGPVIGRPADLVEKTYTLATDANSDNTNSAERAAAGALYDVMLEPAMEAYAIGRLNKAGAAAAVWGSGNREGGILPSDRDFFIEALAGEKEE